MNKLLTQVIGKNVLIKCIDNFYYGIPHFAGSYAIIDKNGEAALFDTGTPGHYREITQQLRSIGVTADNLTKIIVSHVHMDHSGNSSLLTRDYPNAKLYAHPRSIAHLVDPSLLISQTKAIIGKKYETEYGNMVFPIDERRIIPTCDEMEISFDSNVKLSILNSEGHSRHHISLHIPELKIMLTGDSFGSRYSHIDHSITFTSTSPPTFNPDKMIESIKKMMGKDVKYIGLAHYGIYDDPIYHMNENIKWLEKMKVIARSDKDIKHAVYDEFSKLYGNLLDEFRENLMPDLITNQYGVTCYANWLKNNHQ